MTLYKLTFYSLKRHLPEKYLKENLCLKIIHLKYFPLQITNLTVNLILLQSQISLMKKVLFKMSNPKNAKGNEQSNCI